MLGQSTLKYTMLRCSLTLAAVASWIEFLRHRAIDIWIDFNKVSCIFRVIAAWVAELANIQETRLYFWKNDANACEAQEGKCVCSIYSHLSCAAVAYTVPNTF